MPDRRCASCGAVVPPEAIGCPRCMLELGLEDDRSRDATATPGGPAAAGDAAADGRFLPGQLLLGRYRIVAPVGRGGMGEVYRADDLKLGEPVALKFLPEELRDDPELMSGLLNEVRLARKISHPNVCRVFDVQELDGQPFLTMEYVDGEDLANLLRRIGRLPQDRAITVAHQVLAGLAAVHQRGILHQDVKPANVMLDGHGTVRLMDFGLSGAARLAPNSRLRAGTPAYMAPERLAGNSASEQSDLYSAGLLLYEIFTGRRPFARPSAERSVTPPSVHVRGLDARVDALILRCLDPDPAGRPPSALAAATQLPGSDRFSATIAPGETPPPNLVADAGGSGGLRRRDAWGLLLAFVLLVLGGVLLSSKTQLTRTIELGRSIDALRDRASEIVVQLGQDDEPTDWTFGFEYDRGLPERGDRGSPGPFPVTFWYRQSPEYLVRADAASRRPSYDDPPWVVPGMAGVRLDVEGRLVEFRAIPPERAPAGPFGDGPDWDAMLRLAGLEPAEVEEVEPAWLPGTFADSRHAWEGRHPSVPSVTARVEAASLAGTPVAFRVLGPWSRRSHARSTVPPVPMASNARPWSGTFSPTEPGALYLAMLFIALLGGAIVARSNVRAGRGDQRGALRLALYLLGAGMAIWVLDAHHVPTGEEPRMFVRGLSVALFWSSVAWLFYVAVEPFLRRIWPRTMVSWIRLLEGRFRDPLVGRDVLIGCVVGVVLSVTVQLYQVTPGWLGLAPPRPDALNVPTNELDALRGLRHAIAGVLTVHWKQTFYALLYGCVLVILKLVFRRTSVAVASFVILGAVLAYRPTGRPVADLALAASLALMCAAVFFRFGLLTVVTSLTVAYLAGAVTLTLDLYSWYSDGAALVLSVYLGLALWGFRASLAGRGMFGDVLLRHHDTM